MTTNPTRIVWGKNEVVPDIEVPSILLCDPKKPQNVGAAIRNASAYGIKQVWFTGDRVGQWLFDNKAKRIPREERMKGYGKVQVINYDYPFDILPRDAVPVAIEIGKGYVPLTMFDHPQNAVYVFGPEDGSIPTVIERMCHYHIVIPTYHCLNLAVAIGTVLYSRSEYMYRNYGEQISLAESRGFDCELESIE